jgi:transcription termination factor Rho
MKLPRRARRSPPALGFRGAMSVLQREELEGSSLADLHAIASELGLEGFRSMRKDDLVAAILRGQGEDEASDGDEREPDEVPADEALDGPAAVAESPRAGADEHEDAEEPPPEQIVSGVLDILPNGSGFVRGEGAAHSPADVYVSSAQIRRCELRAGDEISGPVRSARRHERHPSLVHVATVNGADPEPPEERPHFGDLRAVFPSERLAAPPALEDVPYGKGSRVALSGPPGAGATRLLREIVRTLRERHPDLPVQVVLAGARPEEVAEWEGGEVTGGSFDRSPEAQAQAAELAVERAKRRVERGEHAAIAIDSLEPLPPGARRRVFGAARATEEGGSLTVFAVTGDGSEALRWATTRIVLEPPGADSPKVARAQSGSLRADQLR